MLFLFLCMVGQPARFGLLLLGLLLAIYGPFCIRAYKIAVGCCTLFSSSIITVELLAYRWSRSVRYTIVVRGDRKSCPKIHVSVWFSRRFSN